MMWVIMLEKIDSWLAAFVDILACWQ